MPELPDIEVYIEALDRRILGQTLKDIRLRSPFLLRSVQPPIRDAVGREVTGLRRVGKRIAIGMDGDLWLVLHLMIAGRLHWKAADAKLAGKHDLAAFDFADGSLVLTEAGSKKRASLYVVLGEAALVALDPGGIEPLDADLPAFREALVAENHTLKRALTDPRRFSGVGNAYSDEILHAAGLSPIARSQSLSDDEIARLHGATQKTLRHWVDLLRAETGEGFPEKVTAFRDGMAVHGRHEQPCPVCAAPVQRIRYASNETNYCARCQTGGKILADRALSRLLKGDWPRTLEELEGA
jgi:formamidopyrimidine-DNA glycosylase